jgi:CRP/FNR family transcriptional regulator, cyclic AMP receptor protein
MRSVGALSDFGIDLSIAAASDLLIRRADRRIAATLLRVTGVETGIRPSDPAGFFPDTSRVGEMANASRDVVHRTLRRFEAKRWLTLGYNRINILAPGALAAFVKDGE